MDAFLDDGQESAEAPDETLGNETDTGPDNETGEAGDDAPTGPDVVLGPEVPGDAPAAEPTPTATPTPAPATPLTPLEPVATPTPTATPPPAATPPTAATPAPTPPPPTPTPPPPTPTPPSPEPQAWPREGSYVKYAWRIGQYFAGSPQGWTHYGNITWTYAGGDWRAVCVMEAYDRNHDGTWNNHTIRREITAATPPHWPLMNTRSPPAPGEAVTTWYLRDCELSEQTLYYVGTETEATTVNGQPATVPTHLAEDDYPPEQPMSWSSEWSTKTGLVVDWGYSRGGMAAHSNSGRLVDTDAPLA